MASEDGRNVGGGVTDARTDGGAERDYTDRELMVAAAAAEIDDSDVTFVGMRLPLIAF